MAREQPTDKTDRQWCYAKRPCPSCGSDKTWTNTDDFKCESCGRTTEGGGFSRTDATTPATQDGDVA